MCARWPRPRRPARRPARPGAIEVGRRADYLILDEELHILDVYRAGVRVGP